MRQVKADNLPMRIGQVIYALSLQLLDNIATALGTTMSSLCAAAEGLDSPASLPNEFQVNFSKDFSDDAIQLRQTFHQLTSENQRIAVALLQALRQTQG
jgi:hypothetical protein